jgi:hypothetical protein
MVKGKSPTMDSSKSDQGKATDLAQKAARPRAVSVYLSDKDRASLEEIARMHNINRHMLLSYAVRYFLVGYRTGRIKLDPTIEAGKVVLNVHLDLQDVLDN